MNLNGCSLSTPTWADPGIWIIVTLASSQFCLLNFVNSNAFIIKHIFFCSNKIRHDKMTCQSEKMTERLPKGIFGCCTLPCLDSHAHMNTHLNVPVGQQQVNDYIGGEQLDTVEAFLDAAQFFAQVLAAEPLPRHANLMPDRLPEVLAVSIKSTGVMTFHTFTIFNESAK